MPASDSARDRAAWIEGPSAHCSPAPAAKDSPWRLVLLGPPGVGKGTQAQLLRDRLAACHLSTGDIFRAAGTRPVCDQTPAMREAIGYMKRGELVPDSTVWEMVRERGNCLRCGGGFLLDGFPRTLSQAEALQEYLDRERIPLTGVVSYELPIEEIVSRLSGRRTCKQCKAVFHETQQPPTVAGTCDCCGGLLLQRDDDRPEAVTVRMQAYERSTAPLIDFYQRGGLLIRVAASGTPGEICERTLTMLEQRREGVSV